MTKCMANTIGWALVIAIFAIPAFFIAGGIYTKWNGIRGLTYLKTSCRVSSTYTYSDTCKMRRSKYTSWEYTCYGVMWFVYHGENKNIEATIKDPVKHSSQYDAIGAADQYKINSTYSCWYNPKKPVEAEWNKSSIVGFILLMCGTALTLISFIICGCSILLAKGSELPSEENQRVYYITY